MSLKKPISPMRKQALLQLAKMPAKDRTRLLKLEAARRGLTPKKG